MLLDKTLVLKGVAGVAALGGVGGGAYIYREELGIVSSSKKGADVQDLTSVDNKGIPNRCADSTPCSLTLEDLKKIKFKDLDNGAAETVEPTSDSITLTLTITTTDGNKKYTFNNNGAAISLKKGSDKTVTLNANATTEFTEEGEALKKVDGTSQSPQKAQTSDVDDKGIPTKCNTSGSCQLTADELKKIKFQALDGSAAETIDPSSPSGTITLTIQTSPTQKYTFNNSGTQITLKRGEGKTVTLKGSGTTEFTVENKALKLVEAPAPTTDNKGIPSRCTTAGASPCQLTADELKKIKFQALDGSAAETIEPSSPSGTITLTISSESNKKYTFNNSSSSAVTLKKGSNKTVTLNTGTSEFTEESGALKEVAKPKTTVDIGIPTKCSDAATNPCQLTADDLKNIKFKVLEEINEGTVTIDPASPASNTITLSISASGSNPKIYTFKNSGSKVTLTKGSGSNNSVVLESGDTEFTVESNKLKSYEDSSFTAVNTKIGNLNLPNKCKFKSADNGKTTKDCDVTVDELKKVKFENKQDNQDLTIEGVTDKVRLQIKVLKSDSDADQYGSTVFKDNDPLITFKDTTSKITIKGPDSNNIVIPKKSNTEFLINTSSGGGKLSKYMKGLSSVPPSWGIMCSAASGSTTKWNCTPHSTSSNFPKFFENNLSTFKELKISDQNKNIFEASGDTDDYSLGFKFRVLDAISGTDNSVSLTANDTYEIKYVSGKGWGYVKKN